MTKNRTETAIPEDALNRVDQHWAVKAVVGTDSKLVERIAMAYELAVIEGLDELLHPSSDEERSQLRLQAQAGAYRAYTLMRTLPIPSDQKDLIFHVLRLAALAYCGEQQTDLRRWLKDHEVTLPSVSVSDATWDNHVFRLLFDCWVRLLRKQGRDDINRVKEIIVGLRKDQEQYEKGFLAKLDNAIAQVAALRLIALYHWLKATELLAVYMLQEQSAGIEAELDKHFEAGQRAASAAQDATLEVILRWLHVTSYLMVKEESKGGQG